MKSKGYLVQHVIKRAKRPVISEVNSPVIQTLPQKTSVPKYTIICEPEKDPEYLVVQVNLERLVDCTDLEKYERLYIGYRKKEAVI